MNIYTVFYSNSTLYYVFAFKLLKIWDKIAYKKKILLF